MLDFLAAVTGVLGFGIALATWLEIGPRRLVELLRKRKLTVAGVALLVAGLGMMELLRVGPSCWLPPDGSLSALAEFEERCTW